MHQRRLVTARLMGSKFVPGSGLPANSSLGRDFLQIRPGVGTSWVGTSWVGTSSNSSLGRDFLQIRPWVGTPGSGLPGRDFR
jgi:hypothetical protein